MTATHTQLVLTMPVASTSDIERVLQFIKQHEGRERAIRIDAISARTGVPYRDVQDIAKHLVEERHIPIGTLWSKPFGYYIINSEDDLGLNAWQFLRRGVSSIKHGRAYLTPAIAGPIRGQIDLFVVSIEPFVAELEERFGGRR